MSLLLLFAGAGVGAPPVVGDADEVTTANAYFRRVATVDDGGFRRTAKTTNGTFRRAVTTADTER